MFHLSRALIPVVRPLVVELRTTADVTQKADLLANILNCVRVLPTFPVVFQGEIERAFADLQAGRTADLDLSLRRELDWMVANRLLVVDDEPEVANGVARELRRLLGLEQEEVAVAFAMESALQVYREGQADIAAVVTDVDMSFEGAGLLFHKGLREDGFPGPIVIMSGREPDEISGILALNPATRFFRKPADVGEVASSIARFWEHGPYPPLWDDLSPATRKVLLDHCTSLRDSSPDLMAGILGSDQGHLFFLRERINSWSTALVPNFRFLEAREVSDRDLEEICTEIGTFTPLIADLLLVLADQKRKGTALGSDFWKSVQIPLSLKNLLEEAQRGNFPQQLPPPLRDQVSRMANLVAENLS